MTETQEKKDFDEIKKYALSNFDIEKVVPHINIFTYPHLENVRHIDEVLDKHGRAIMLYLTDDTRTGHFLAILKHGNTIEVFDPYGVKPDEQGKFLGGKMNEGKSKYQTLLTDLIRESGYGMKYNKTRHQPVSEDISTCGRHAILRVLTSHLPLEEYNKRITKIARDTGVSVDDIATGMTAGITGDE